MSTNFEPGEQSDSVNIICPYCGHDVQAECEDAEESPKETECGECGKPFIQWAYIDITYYTKRMEDE